MRLFFTERPSALPAALVQVVAVPVRPAAAAHVSVVGQPAVRTVAANGIPQLQVRTQRAAYLAAGGNAGKGIDRGDYTMKGASGVPPRGRPV